MFVHKDIILLMVMQMVVILDVFNVLKDIQQKVEKQLEQIFLHVQYVVQDILDQQQTVKQDVTNVLVDFGH